MNQKTKEYRGNLANAFLTILEEKELDWKKEWQGKVNGFGRQENAKSGHRYRGLNNFYLTMVAADRGYEDPRWATFKQVQEKGWRLKDAKGQGVKVEYWFPFDTKEKKSVSWEDFKKQELNIAERYILRVSYATVFNASLIEGIPKLPEPEIHPQVAADEFISRISKNMGVEIMNDGGDRAYYNLLEDRIHLPGPEYFFSDYAYNSTALHELSHATGAGHRLNRKISGDHNSPEYAYEELVAEISSCFMSANLPIAQDESHIENHKAYVQSWVQAIKDDPETLVKAIQQAEKAAGYLEYKAELLTEKEFQQINGSSMEISAEHVTERDETKEQDEQHKTEQLGSMENEMTQNEQQGEKVIYYPIDEAAARRAKEANSFSDYKQGHATAEYRRAVDEAIRIAEQQKTKTDPMYHDKIDSLLDTYARKLAKNMNDRFYIDARVPPMLLTGGGNFPTRKKEKQNAARDKNMEEYTKIQELLDKIRSTGKGGISADDPRAIQKLQSKLADLEKAQETMKAVNAYYRKNKTLDGCPDLSQEHITRLKKEIAERWLGEGAKPFEAFALSNNSAEIRRVKNRIQELSKRETAEYKEWEFDGGKVEANTEANRLQIFFEEKPNEETRTELKGNGFRWSPKAGAWQRQLNGNAYYAANNIKAIQPLIGGEERLVDLDRLSIEPETSMEIGVDHNLQNDQEKTALKRCMEKTAFRTPKGKSIERTR